MSHSAEHNDLPIVAGVTHRFVDVDGLRMHVAEAGKGDPILLLHGWPQHWYCWRKVVANLASRYRLVMPDLRGFGWSDVPPGGYDPEHFAADAVRLLDVLGLKRVNVIGHDWGGVTAFLMALHHPDRVSKLLVCNAPHPWARLSFGVAAGLWRTWYVALVSAPTGPTLLTKTSFIPFLMRCGGRAALFSDDEAEVYAARLREPARARASRALYSNYLGVARDLFLKRRYDSIPLQCPGLILFGADDFYVPQSYLKGWEGHAREFRIELVPNCSHWTPEERPDLVAERARALFD